MPNQIKFYTDSHIAMAVTIQLRNKGIDIIHCAEIGMENAKDADHLEYAAAEGRTVVTCDQDFFALNKQWQAQGKHHAGIIFVRSENQGNKGKMVNYLVKLCVRVAEKADVLQNEVHNMILYL